MLNHVVHKALGGEGPAVSVTVLPECDDCAEAEVTCSSVRAPVLLTR
jgi:hypothetical protein